MRSFCDQGLGVGVGVGDPSGAVFGGRGYMTIVSSPDLWISLCAANRCRL